MLGKIFVNWEAALFWFSIGVFSATLVAHIYYKKSSNEQQIQFNLLSRALENAEIGVKFNRNEKGDPIGVVINLRSHAQVKTKTSEVNLDIKK